MKKRPVAWRELGVAQMLADDFHLTFQEAVPVLVVAVLLQFGGVGRIFASIGKGFAGLWRVPVPGNKEAPALSWYTNGRRTVFLRNFAFLFLSFV